MLTNMGRRIVNRPKIVLVTWAVFLVLSIVLGAGVTKTLVTDPGGIKGSESEAVADTLDQLGMSDPAIIAAIDGTAVDSLELQNEVVSATDRIRAIEGVTVVADRFTTQLPQLTSIDEMATLIAVSVDPRLDESGRAEVVEQAEHVLREIDAPRVLVGGASLLETESVEQNERDLKRAELLSLPIVLLVLFFIFGGFRAAVLPVLVAVVAVPGTLLVLTAAGQFTELSVYALNAASMLGLGLAVDYSLLVVSRFRTERGKGLRVEDAIIRTLETAGRTVFFSGLTVAVSLVGFLAFDTVVFTSIGIGGIGVVLLAMIAALTLLPAALAVIGHGISVPAPDAGEASIFGVVAQLVQRRAGMVAAGVTVVLIALGIPFLGARLQIPGAEGLPTSLETRQLFDLREERFVTGGDDPIVLVATGPADVLAALSAVIASDEAVTDVAERFGAPDGTIVLDIGVDGAGQSARSEQLVTDLRALPVDGVDIRVGGPAAHLVDGKDRLFGRLPIALGLMGTATIVLLFLLTGSVLIPFKAMAVNALSLTATFGVLVWGFQDGALGGVLGFESLGYINLFIPFLIFFLAFGLSMDYEVFLLSRIAEIHDELIAEGHPAPNDEAVRRGMVATGGIITSAAALIAIVFGAFATASTVDVKALGVGLAMAIILDSTVVRLLLVPASMRLMGEWNWWAPAPLRRFHDRFGVTEQSTPGDLGWSDDLHVDLVTMVRQITVRHTHDARPLLVAEVWSADTRPGVIESRRSFWRSLGLEHYWEIVLGDSADETAMSVWQLDGDRDPRRAVGHDELVISEPFPIEVTPADLHSWTDSRTQRLETLAAELERRTRELEHENARLTQQLSNLGR